MYSGHALIGSWKLEAFELEATDGAISHPYGTDLAGYLFYNEQGFMSAAFMNAERGRIADGELSEAAKASTYDQFMAYTGPFEITGDKIRHFVEVSSLEVWTGTFQERWFKIDGDRLELLTQALSVGRDAPVGRLVWTRVSSAAFPK
jgi:hypothetical protein